MPISTPINTLFSLLKYKVSLSVTFTAITGYIVFSKALHLELLALAIGVFILAGGSSALNQFQEKESDAKMLRTKGRPIPAGNISPLNAFITSIVLILIGSIILYCNFSEITVFLGLVTVIWYNLIYTYLKRVTAFAVVPGSLVGAIPALIGWTAAGGYVINSTIIYIAFFLFIWQIPHFLLLLIKYGDQYEQAGFPTINKTVSPESLKRIIFSWILGTSISSILIPVFLNEISFLFFISIFVLNVLFVGIFVKLSFGKMASVSYKKSFISINVYMLIFMTILIIFHLIRIPNL